ncbi:MAG: alpha/beta fold hydrolase, partial [Ktedonobacteraceae bacterium]|nr:alpha/beta fold hydrolase [Ktedonobacteraceae bacterium]
MSNQQPLYPEAIAAYDTYGPVHGLPLVFLHAGALTRKMWQPQIAELSKAFRIIALDLPGHGALAQHTFSLKMAVEEVAQIIRKEVQGQALVIGLALGSFVALALAHEHPELVAGLVVSGCSINAEGMSETLLKIRGTLLANNVALLDRMLATVTEKVLSRFYSDQFVKAQAQAGIYWKGAGQGLLDCTGKDFRAMLHSYRGPVLVLNGENDKNSRKSEETLLSAANQGNIKVQALREAGHLCNVDQPRAYNNALRNFTQADLY